MVARVMVDGRWHSLVEAQEITDRIFKRDRRGRFAGNGPGPGGGEDLIAAGRADEIAQGAFDVAAAQPRPEGASELAGRRLYRGGGVGPHGDEALHHIAAQQGFDGPASSMSARDMSKGVRQGDTEMFRGVRGRDGKSAQQIHDQVATGEAYYGLGFSGNGMYMSSSRAIAGEYGTVSRYALSREAKVVDYRQLQDEQSTFLKTLDADSVTARVFSDPGRYAAARGYDAIRWARGEEAGRRVGEEDELMILNRTALIVES